MKKAVLAVILLIIIFVGGYLSLNRATEPTVDASTGLLLTSSIHSAQESADLYYANNDEWPAKDTKYTYDELEGKCDLIVDLGKASDFLVGMESEGNAKVDADHYLQLDVDILNDNLPDGDDVSTIMTSFGAAADINVMYVIAVGGEDDGKVLCLYGIDNN